MIAKILTAAQRRAREWLPADGSWREQPGRMSMALYSLSNAWSGCLEHEWGKFGHKAGYCQRWRFTALGVETNKTVPK